ncbi:MAG: restriction endonuclease [Candidatus Thiodiazotropha sp.]
MIIRSYVRKFISKSGRIQIPSEMRDSFSGDLVLTVTPQRALSLHVPDHWEKYEDQLKSLPSIEEQNRNLQRLIIGSAYEVGLDKKNRILIPRDLTEFAELQDDTAILCVGNMARIVPKRKWKQLHTNPNSCESRELLNDLSLPFFNKNLSSEVVRKVEDALSIKYKLLLECSKNKEYRQFELLIGEIFDAHRIGVVEVTQYSNDDGIDLVIYIESGSGINVLFIQLKAGNAVATVSDLRELIGVISLHGGNAGLLVTASGFTSTAKDTSTESLGTRIKTDLSDAQKLSKWIENRLSVII